MDLAVPKLQECVDVKPATVSVHRDDWCAVFRVKV